MIPIREQAVNQKITENAIGKMVVTENDMRNRNSWENEEQIIIVLIRVEEKNTRDESSVKNGRQSLSSQ